MAACARKLKLEPGESRQVTFLIGWHFPNLSIPIPLTLRPLLCNQILLRGGGG